MTARLTRLKGTPLETGTGASQAGPMGPPGPAGETTGIDDAPANGTLYARKDNAWAQIAGAGTGDVIGPDGAITSDFASFDGVDGKLLKDSGWCPEDFAVVDHTHPATTGHTIQNGGDTLPTREFLNFKGAGVLAEDNPVTGATDINIAGGVGVWNPNYPPVTPHILDDEFDDESFDGGSWITSDELTSLTIEENEIGLILHNTENVLSGIYKEIPVGGIFTAWTKVHAVGGTTNVGNGLWLLDEAVESPPSGPRVLVVSANLDLYGAWIISSVLYDDYTKSNPDVLMSIGYNDFPISGMFIRARYNDSDNVYFDISVDGITWRFAGNHIFTPKYVGLFSADSSSSRAIFPFFRVVETFDEFQVMHGRRI